MISLGGKSGWNFTHSIEYFGSSHMNLPTEGRKGGGIVSEAVKQRDEAAAAGRETQTSGVRGEATERGA